MKSMTTSISAATLPTNTQPTNGHRYSLSNMMKRHSISFSKRPSLSIRKLLPKIVQSTEKETPDIPCLPQLSPLQSSMNSYVESNNMMLNEIIDDMACLKSSTGSTFDRGNDIIEEENGIMDSFDEFDIGGTSEDTCDEH